MNTRKTIFAQGLFGLAVLLGSMTSAGAARADHNYRVLRAKADAVFQSMIQLDRTLVDHYARSRVFGEMMATSGQIKAKAVYLRGMSYHNSPCEWSRELTGLHSLVHNLETLIEKAHLRANRGFDPPIAYCAVEASHRLESIIALVHCMEDALVTAPVVVYPGHGHGHLGGYGSPYGYSGETYGDHHHYSGYRGGRNGINLNGNRGGNVRIDAGGLSIGKGGVQFRIQF